MSVQMIVIDPSVSTAGRLLMMALLLAILWVPKARAGWRETSFAIFQPAGFQAVSIMTTTGFATADFDQWTTAAKFMLLLLMIIGACAGSTGGAISGCKNTIDI